MDRAALVDLLVLRSCDALVIAIDSEECGESEGISAFDVLNLGVEMLSRIVLIFVGAIVLLQ